MSGTDGAEPGPSSSSGQSSNQQGKSIANLIDALALQGRQPQKKSNKEKYAFWETQPVMQFIEEGKEAADGPIDAPKTVQDIRKEPYALPDSFVWCECNIDDDGETQEVYTLLHNNYVEDDDAMFRFNYSPAFLKWALQPPGYRKDWHVGVRVKSSGKLVAFISAIPSTVLANGQTIRAVEINFLCVLKKLRSKRLAPVLIKEITRRVNLQDIWQAAYTAGVVLPKPVASCRYWHRSLNPKKLIDVGFSALQARMTMARTIKLYKLPAAPATAGLRPMEARDVAAVTQLLNDYLQQFKLTQHYSEDEVLHWFLPQDMVIDTYVVDTSDQQQQSQPNSTSNASANGSSSSSSSIVSMVSFYTLPSSVLGHDEHKELRAAYMFYTAEDRMSVILELSPSAGYAVPGATPLPQLINDALILAHNKGYDVFNALNLLENTSFLKDLKFGVGDGALHYYLYNWRMANAPLEPKQLGLILL